MAKDFDCYCLTEGSPKTGCYNCKGTGYDTHCTDEPVCPWCGGKMSEDELYESTTRACDICDKDVVIEVEYSRSYSTVRHDYEAETPKELERCRKGLDLYKQWVRPALYALIRLPITERAGLLEKAKEMCERVCTNTEASELLEQVATAWASERGK